MSRIQNIVSNFNFKIDSNQHKFEFLEKTNILQLPEEMTAEILKYLSDHRALSQVCKKFHEISCEVKYYGLHLESDPGHRFDCFDHNTYNLLINSRRRFKSLTIDGFYQGSSAMNDWDISERCMGIVEHFGRHIEELTVKFIHMYSILRLLNFMPNLKKINMYRISAYKFYGSYDNDFKLNLNKLKEIKSSFSNSEVMNIFKTLLPGVLRKINVTFHEDSITSEANQAMKLFEFQENIEEVEASERFAELINFQRMQLKKLKLWGVNDLNRILFGQRKITSFELSSIKVGDLKVICNELLSLKELKVGYAENISNYDFAELPKLNNLTKLSLEYVGSEEEVNTALSYAKCENLLELNLTCLSTGVSITDSTFVHIGKNMPKLRVMSLKTEMPLNSLNSIVRHLKDLEILCIIKTLQSLAEQFVFQEDFTNEKLQELEISGGMSDNIEELPLLIGHCKNLKTLFLRIGQPKINFFKLLKEHCRTLNHIECTCSVNDDKNALQEIIQEFKDQFINLDLYDD